MCLLLRGGEFAQRGEFDQRGSIVADLLIKLLSSIADADADAVAAHQSIAAVAVAVVANAVVVAS